MWIVAVELARFPLAEVVLTARPSVGEVTAHPVALDLRQAVQRVLQMVKKPLLEFQNLVLGELIQASGILDAVPAVQWILCLVACDMPLVGRLIVGAGTEHLGHISRNFHILILDVTAAKVAQTDNRHGNRQLCVWYSRLR